MKPRNVMPENQSFMPLNNPMNYQYPSSYQVPSQFQRDPPFYQQNKPRESPGLGMPNNLNYQPPQMNLPYQSHTNNGFNKAYNGPYHPMANTNYPPINKAFSQGEFNGFAQYPPIGMQNNPYGQYGHQNPSYQPQPRSYPQTSYFPGYENNQPDINNPFRYPQEYQSAVVNQYNPLNNPYQYPAHQHQAQRSHYVGYEQSHGGASRGSSIEKAGSNPSLEKTPPRKGSRGLSQHQRAYGSQGANEVKTFTFTRNVQSNVLEVEKLKEAMEGLDQHNPSETSTMSRKTLDPLSEAGKAILKGGGARSTIREESINYAVKRLQRKEYHTKKPSRNFKKREEKEKDEEIEEDKEEDKIKEIINGDVRLVANTGLMHLLVDG